jgi:N-sulfoglucosamine sulfohydrolase
MMKTMKLLLISILSFIIYPSVAQKKPNILFCIADDWGKHAGVYGDKVVKTPNFDRLAQEGVLFTNAFCGSPSCTPSRATILTGRYPHQNEESGNLWSTLQTKLPNYASILAQNGYYVGLERKGWGPGDFRVGGYAQNPAGKSYKNFEEFLEKKPNGQPFCYWFGSQDPHRTYEAGTGKASGMNPGEVRVPAYWPDTPEVRDDILDYYYEVQRFDREVGELLKRLEVLGELENTLVVVTSDNGMPFPRAKANVYDAGTNLPLVVYWKGKIPAHTTNTFMSFADFAPTFLEAAHLPIPKEMSGKSLWPLLRKEIQNHRNEVFIERERHANVRRGDQSYPIRAIRTHEYLYIKNLEPNRWPAGDPQLYFAVGSYGDVDPGPTKNMILSDTVKYAYYYQWVFAKRPAEELYDLKKDPEQINNLANNKSYQGIKKKLSEQLVQWQKETADPRAAGKRPFETYPYYGNSAKTEQMKN